MFRFIQFMFATEQLKVKSSDAHEVIVRDLGGVGVNKC